MFSFLSRLPHHKPKGCQQVSVFNRQAPAFSSVLGLQSFSSKCQFTSPNPSAKPSSLQGPREAAASFKWCLRRHLLLLSVVNISWRLAGPITLAAPDIAIAVRWLMRRVCARRRAAGLVVVLRSIAVYSGVVLAWPGVRPRLYRVYQATNGIDVTG